MKIGTKSLLFGAHQFILHPVLVAFAWYRLYGFPFDPRLWIAFIVHDWGYWGKGDMDGSEGETHVLLGARIMGVFGSQWADFTRHHSRFYSRIDGAHPSRLCYADKLALCMELPAFYLFRTRLTGELAEYMALSANGKYSCPEYMNRSIDRPRSWFAAVKSFTVRFVAKHGRI
ncbi:hypothetical protein [uncultured Allobaculum sp.]|uniref:hypothetical protein n=1 Tax=uncultured Allobaculum sp. TaxID=1187017 RepID=UPI00260FAD08|nr:hypothetical protein [uncultured Allobaculum sp.]MCX4302376.1 hypothetical protein [Alistipes sp.]